jgi:hypothetical protein
MAEGRTAYPVAEDDWYVEPLSSTAFLLDREDFADLVWDPCCGLGNIVTTVISRGGEAIGTDLRARYGVEAEPWFAGISDFMDESTVQPLARNIVMNPPYGKAKLAEAFIRKAAAWPGIQKVAAFTNAKFLFGSGRNAGLWTAIPPHRVYPVNPRPSCPPGEFLRAGGKATGGVENFCWLVWDIADPTGRTEFIWNAEEDEPI